MDPKTYRLLQEQDWESIGKELVAYGARLAWIYNWRDGSKWELVAGITVVDLVQEIIEKAIEGRRNWDPNKGDLRPWLKAVLRSDMNHLYHSEEHNNEAAVPESDHSEASDGLIGNVQYREYKAASQVVIGSSIPEPEKALIEKEEKERIEQRANEVLLAVDGDQELEEVVEAIINGCEPRPRYLAEEIGVPISNINNRLKRLRRCAAKLMKGADS